MDIVDYKIQEYAEKYTSCESDALRKLRELTEAKRGDRQMLSGFYQGRLLAMFSQLLRPRRILEIGTFTGYSALCLAEGLADDGKIITLDIEPETNEIAKEFWSQTEYNSKIESYLGNALEIIPTLDEIFDLVFIDADKSNYANYYDLVLPKLRVGGLIIADNVLWSGKVVEAEEGWTIDASGQALHDYNVKVNRDDRVTTILLAVRDGLMIARKEKE